MERLILMIGMCIGEDNINISLPSHTDTYVINFFPFLEHLPGECFGHVTVKHAALNYT